MRSGIASRRPGQRDCAQSEFARPRFVPRSPGELVARQADRGAVLPFGSTISSSREHRSACKIRRFGKRCTLRQVASSRRVSLDGMAYMRGWYPRLRRDQLDEPAHRRMPVVAEASGGVYEWYGRVSDLLACLMSCVGHERAALAGNSLWRPNQPRQQDLTRSGNRRSGRRVELPGALSCRLHYSARSSASATPNRVTPAFP
jgi:hypothetical protein